MKIYLAGPITGLSWDGATDWRKFVKENINESIQTLSPLRGKEFLKKAKTISDNYSEMPLASIKGINTRDYNDVRTCDALLVNFLDSQNVSIGTVMEIAWARAFNKPVVCVMEADNIHNHSMLNYACGYIINTLEEGIKIIESILLTDQAIAKYKKEVV